MTGVFRDLKEMIFGKDPNQEDLDTFQILKDAHNSGVRIFVSENGSVTRPQNLLKNREKNQNQ